MQCIDSEVKGHVIIFTDIERGREESGEGRGKKGEERGEEAKIWYNK